VRLLPIETLGAYVVDAIAVVLPSAIYEPQVDTRDPRLVLCEHSRRILGGDYSHTIREICNDALVPPEILTCLLLKRFSEAAMWEPRK